MPREEKYSKAFNDPMLYYAPSNLYNYEDTYADEDEDLFEGESPNAPAELTDVPTSSTNAGRPRTVAAGYDKNRRVLTVVFRDGTVWNYPEVSEGDWINFKTSISKGRPWINNQLFGLGEAADVSKLDPAVQAELYSRARTAQIKYQTQRRYKAPNISTLVPRVGKTGALKAQRELRRKTPKTNGKNTSKGGKNPS